MRCTALEYVVSPPVEQFIIWNSGIHHYLWQIKRENSNQISIWIWSPTLYRLHFRNTCYAINNIQQKWWDIILNKMNYIRNPNVYLPLSDFFFFMKKWRKANEKIILLEHFLVNFRCEMKILRELVFHYSRSSQFLQKSSKKCEFEWKCHFLWGFLFWEFIYRANTDQVDLIEFR